MSVTEITHIEILPFDRGQIAGFALDSPVASGTHDAHGFVCSGWVLGEGTPAVGVELVGEDGTIYCIPMGYPRPDVSQQYPKAADGALAGWWSPIGIIGKGSNFEFRLQAVLEHLPQPVPLANIRGHRRTLPPCRAGGIQPLMVTSLARSGSTWLMRLLLEHPSVVADKTHPYEVTPVRNWMQFLSSLTQPSAEAQPFSFGSVEPPTPLWRNGPAFSDASLLLPPEMHGWFGRKFVERSVEFFRQNAEDCYRELAARQHKATPRFFAEKHQPYEIPGIVWEVYPQAREIFLVRDFRDMVCSIAAFNRKRDRADFGRSLADTDEQYILQMGDKARRLLRAWNKRKGRAHLVRYEDLVSQPAATLAGILNYLGLPADSAQIDRMIGSASADTPEMRHHCTAPNAIQSVGRWRRDLAPDLQEICRHAFGTTLAEFGYSEPSARSEASA